MKRTTLFVRRDRRRGRSHTRQAAALALMGAAIPLGGATTAAAQSGPPTYKVQQIGTFAAHDTSFSYARGLNARGQVVGDAALSNARGWHAYRYDSSTGKKIDLTGAAFGKDASGGSYSTALAINDNGQIVGAAQVFDSHGTSKGQHAFLYDGTGGRGKNLFDIGAALVASSAFGSAAGGYSYSYPNGLNPGGQTVGQADVYDGSGTFKGQHAFLYDPATGKVSDLTGASFGKDAGGNSYSNALGINHNGQVVGYADVYDGSGSSKGRHAFLYNVKTGSITDLGAGIGALNALPPSGGYINSYATAINKLGQVIVNAELFDAQGFFTGAHAFVYDCASGNATDLGAVLAVSGAFGAGRSTGSSRATVINGRGQVVGQVDVLDAQGNPLGQQHAYLYDSKTGKVTDVDTGILVDGTASGLSLSYPAAINESGQVVGIATNTWTWKGFLYSGGVVYGLDALAAGTTSLPIQEGVAINDAGQIAANTVETAVLLTPSASAARHVHQRAP